MSFAAIAVGVGAVAAAGIAAATRPKAPGSPDYAAATREGYLADIETLPRRKEIEAAARLGTTVLKEGYTSKTIQAGGDEAAQTLSQLEAKAKDAKAAWDEAIAKGPTGRYTLINGHERRFVQDKDQKVDEKKAAYESANTALLNYQNQFKADGGGNQTIYFDKKGNPVSASEAILKDFSGISDIDQSVEAARAQLDFMDETAQAQYDLQQKFGAQFIDQQLEFLKQSDPIGFQMREDMGRKILSEGFGTNLSPSQTQEVQQSARAGQSARGNIFGAAPAAAEAMQVGDAGYRLQQQRLANASSFIQGTTPQAQFGQISNASQGAAPQGSFNLLNGVGLNPNAGGQGAQFASNNYNTQSQNYATGLSNNPWQSLLGSVTQIGVQGVSNSLFGNTQTNANQAGYEQFLP